MTAGTRSRALPGLALAGLVAIVALIVGLSLTREPSEEPLGGAKANQVVLAGGETPPPKPAPALAPPSIPPPSPAIPTAETPPAAPPRTTLTLADGVFPPLLGPPRGPTANFCDEDQWSQLGSILQEFSEGTMLVDERDWVGRGAAARIGMASWVSKCRYSGAAVQIRGDDSGQILAVYDPRNGYRAAQRRR